jgi:hypothetical protein
MRRADSPLTGDCTPGREASVVAAWVRPFVDARCPFPACRR